MVDVEAKALVDRVAVTLRETDAKTIGQPLSELEAEALVDKLKNTLKDAEAQTLGYTN